MPNDNPPTTKPFNVPHEAERLAVALRNDGHLEKSWEGSYALAYEILNLAFAAGYKRGLKEAGSDLL